jgi:hypothetical protein
LVQGFRVSGFIQPLLFGFALSVVNGILSSSQD